MFVGILLEIFRKIINYMNILRCSENVILNKRWRKEMQDALGPHCSQVVLNEGTEEGICDCSSP